jgi:hypothetical protein
VTTRTYHLIALSLCALPLTACDQLGLNKGAKVAAAREAEGRAIGSACRHSGRALEECYKNSAKTSKAAIFAGWRDMDVYMRENNVQVVLPDGTLVPSSVAAESASPVDSTNATSTAEAANAAAADEKPTGDGAAPKNVAAPANEAAARGMGGVEGKRPNRVI